MMAGEAPDFWWKDPGWQSRALSPLASAYASAARWRLDHGERADAGLPVLCVGNFTVGGGGKTPTALALGEAAHGLGLSPGFLSRGHGGALRGPLLVDPSRHHAGAVGDEPMLLAAMAPTAIAVDRKAGASLLRKAGVDLVIMDDGFQSARLVTDLAVLVIDAGRGIGNGCVVPAGPLRAPLTDQIRKADAVLVIGKGTAGDDTIRSSARAGKPLYEAMLRPRHPEEWAGRRVLAFAGIADPRKFYQSLRAVGAEVVATRDFPDHHRFSGEELAELHAAAGRDGLVLATTKKDAVRLVGGDEARREFARSVHVLEVDLVFDPDDVGERLVRQTIKDFRRRRFR